MRPLERFLESLGRAQQQRFFRPYQTSQQQLNAHTRFCYLPNRYLDVGVEPGVDEDMYDDETAADPTDTYEDGDVGDENMEDEDDF
jgi:hypothetical protein